MVNAKASVLTGVLNDIGTGQRDAVDHLLPLVYDDMRALADRYLQQEKQLHTLQATELVHEAFLKLVDQRQVSWAGRTHFFGIGAQIMRRILVDYARRKQRQKHGGGSKKVVFEEGLTLSPKSDADVLVIDDLLNHLAQVDERKARIVECRFFGGLIAKEIAEVLGVSKSTIDKEWRLARAWMRRELASGL